MGDVFPLRRALEDAAAELGCSMRDLTVLERHNDPFRIDTPARHRDGEWLANTARDLGLGDRTIHLRGLHYMVLGRPKPDGTPYSNTEKDWLWLVEDAGKAARFLNYIPFDQITDQRNAEPTVRVFTRPEPQSHISVGVRVDIPDAEDLEPDVFVSDFRGVQPYKLMLIAEKSSVEPALGPIARMHDADLYLPSGHVSDTLIYRMARTGAEDGRPVVVLYFSDCDPSGWNMPVEVARKLQAFKGLHFPDLEFEVQRVALTPDQVREYDLPSTPLKETERRADKWQQAMGVEQTEIDALASLQPDLLRRLTRDAIEPYHDQSLNERVRRAQSDWYDQAREALAQQVDSEALDRIRVDAEARLETLRTEIDAINEALRFDVWGIELPRPIVPEPQLNGGGGKTPLVNSRWSFADQTRRLIESKAYREIGGG